MASTARQSTREGQNSSRRSIVHRMVSLPRILLEGFSHTMRHGIDLIGIGSRRSTHPLPTPNSPIQTTQQSRELDFLATFERAHGPTHPWFYTCGLAEALKVAREDGKFLFMYLHSAGHPFAEAFCRDTLCSEVVRHYLDANFVSWGGIENRGEGFQLAQILRPQSFPFSALIAPSTDDNISVLQQIEGPISPAELVEILQRVVEEQGAAFRSSRAKEAEKIRADRRLREEQDAAYFAALKMDKEKERLKNLSAQESGQRPIQAPNGLNYDKFTNNSPHKVLQASTSRETQQKESEHKAKDPQATQILIRFPNGERREQSFSSTEKVQSIYRFIDSLNLPNIGNYRLVSSFPRRVYGVDQIGQTLKDVGLHPRASLFLELSCNTNN